MHSCPNLRVIKLFQIALYCTGQIWLDKKKHIACVKQPFYYCDIIYFEKERI